MKFCEDNSYLCKNYDSINKKCNICEFYANTGTQYTNGDYCYFDSWNYPFIIIAIFVLLMFLVSGVVLILYAGYNCLGKLSDYIYNFTPENTSKNESDGNPISSYDVEMVPESFLTDSIDAGDKEDIKPVEEVQTNSNN